MVISHPRQFTSGQLWSRKKLQAWTRRWYNWSESLPAALEPKRRRPCYISCSKLEYHQHYIPLQTVLLPTPYPGPNWSITNTIFIIINKMLLSLKGLKYNIMLIVRIAFGHRSCVTYVTTLSAIWWTWRARTGNFRVWLSSATAWWVNTCSTSSQ